MCVCIYVCIYVCVRSMYVFFFYLINLFTSMFHYKIAIVHAKRCLLQTLVPPINTVHLFYLSMPSYVLSSYLLIVLM